jgi:hypothetical protein
LSLEKISIIKQHKFNGKSKPIALVLASYGESYQQATADNSSIQDNRFVK